MAPRRRTPFRSPAFEIGQKVYINVPADDIVNLPAIVTKHAPYGSLDVDDNGRMHLSRVAYWVQCLDGTLHYCIETYLSTHKLPWR